MSSDSDKMDKSIVPTPLSGSAVFLYREDYVLFGLLVRHGLAEMQDHDPLAQYQVSAPNKPSLMELLCQSSDSPEPMRKDLQELLNILSTPELRNYLPQHFPMMETIQDWYSRSTKIAADEVTQKIEQTKHMMPTPIPMKSINIADTVPNHLDQLSTKLDQTALSSLTKAEVERIKDTSTRIPLVGKLVTGHVILDKIGGGAQGDVYLAKQLSLGRYVAMKRLNVASVEEGSPFFEIFREEARTLAQINHPNIVRVYDIFASDGQAFFTMESIEGQTIKDLIKASADGMPLDVVANVACQACSALSRTSEDDLVHRDIKPANMMLDNNGNLKIVDFGLASAVASLQGNKGFAGTPAYAAPEQFDGKDLTPAVDQYSMGVTLYEALTGKNPFKGSRLAEVAGKHKSMIPDLPSTVNTALPREVDSVVMRMLEKNPAKRFKTFDDCYDAWEKVLTGTSSKSSATTAALLGESLLRLGKQESQALTKRGAILALMWFFLAYGAVVAQQKLVFNGKLDLIDLAGKAGTYLLIFSLCCIAYVALARRKFLPVVGSLRAWLITHISTAIPSIILLLIHSGNFMAGIMPGDSIESKPILSILMATTLIVTAVSGSVGLLIFRALRKQIQIQEMGLRKGEKIAPRQAMMMALSAQLLSGWRLVHYPLAVLFVVLSLLHILVSLQFSSVGGH